MLRYVAPILIALGLSGGWVYIFRNWRSVRKSDDPGVPKGRRLATVAALVFVTISTGLLVFLLVHAAITGGYPFYHPVEIACIDVGLLTALLGIVIGVRGARTPFSPCEEQDHS